MREARVSQILPGLRDELVLVNEHDLAIDGFKVLVKHNISGCGVVNNSGEIVDVLSVRDLREIGKLSYCSFVVIFFRTD